MNNKADLFRMKKKFKNSQLDNSVENPNLKGRNKKVSRTNKSIEIKLGKTKIFHQGAKHFHEKI